MNKNDLPTIPLTTRIVYVKRWLDTDVRRLYVSLAWMSLWLSCGECRFKWQTWTSVQEDSSKRKVNELWTLSGDQSVRPVGGGLSNRCTVRVAHDCQKDGCRTGKTDEASTNTKGNLAVFQVREMRVRARTRTCIPAGGCVTNIAGRVLVRPKSYRVAVSNLHYGFSDNQVRYAVHVSACTQRARTDDDGQWTNDTLAMTRRNAARSVIPWFGAEDGASGSQSTCGVRWVAGARREGVGGGVGLQNGRR